MLAPDSKWHARTCSEHPAPVYLQKVAVNRMLDPRDKPKDDNDLKVTASRTNFDEKKPN
jgi:hypothetical protein